MDMNEDTGPTHVFSIKDTSNVLKIIKKYKRNNLIENKNLNIHPYKHTGPKGKSFFCLTSKCLHKAGVPSKNNFRDYLVITFVAYPKKEDKNMFSFEDNFSEEIWNGNTNKLTSSLAKPYNIKQLIKLYKSFI